MAKLYLQENKYEEAERLLRRAVEIDQAIGNRELKRDREALEPVPTLTSEKRSAD